MSHQEQDLTATMGSVTEFRRPRFWLDRAGTIQVISEVWGIDPGDPDAWWIGGFGDGLAASVERLSDVVFSRRAAAWSAARVWTSACSRSAPDSPARPMMLGISEGAARSPAAASRTSPTPCRTPSGGGRGTSWTVSRLSSRIASGLIPQPASRRGFEWLTDPATQNGIARIGVGRLPLAVQLGSGLGCPGAFSPGLTLAHPVAEAPHRSQITGVAGSSPSFCRRFETWTSITWSSPNQFGPHTRSSSWSRLSDTCGCSESASSMSNSVFESSIGTRPRAPRAPGRRSRGRRTAAGGRPRRPPDCAGPRSAQHRSDAGDELARREGLADVVVGADGEADEAVRLVLASGEHDHVGVAGALAQPATDLVAVDPGQRDVEDDHVRIDRGRRLERFLAGPDRGTAKFSSSSTP